MSENVERNYGVDLYRIVLMFLICLFHVLTQGTVVDNSIGFNNYVYKLLLAISYVAVDGYALISGFVANGTKHRFDKLITMWFQVFFYSFGIALCINVLRFVFNAIEPFDLNMVITNIFPIINHKYWYFSSYFFLFFFMPYINKALFTLNEKQSKKALIILFVLMVLMYSTKNYSNFDYVFEGRSVLWLMLMYATGLLIRQSNFLVNIKSGLIFVGYLIMLVISYCSYFSNIDLVSHISPTIWLSAVLLLVLFSRVKPNIKFVSFISPLTFGVYLFHEHFYFRYYYLSERFTYFANISLFNGLIIVFCSTVFIFVLGLIADFIRIKIFELLKINKLSQKIADKIDFILNKIAIY